MLTALPLSLQACSTFFENKEMPKNTKNYGICSIFLKKLMLLVNQVPTVFMIDLSIFNRVFNIILSFIFIEGKLYTKYSVVFKKGKTWTKEL